jgi:hypothetical protein
MKITKSQLIHKPEKLRRHIVLLGAGASVAAFPYGDANGKKLPTMDNIIQMLGLESLLEKGGVKDRGRNFEDIYSKLYEDNPEAPLLKEIEDIVYAYFEALKLPESPTLYDHLVLSLRPKDIIATFNWDPFLFDAWNRNQNKIPVPKIVHLHGNVRVSCCPDHPTYGEHGMYCPECDRELIRTRLLYPVTMKDYAKDIFMKTEWEVLKKGLRQAMTLTIFGYGAPTTDKEAVDIMLSAWDKDHKLIERVEIVDIKDKDVLCTQWDPFVIRTYIDCEKYFYESRIPNFPRRTCEALLDSTFYGLWVERNPIPVNANFDELLFWMKPLVEAERELGV